MPFLRSLDKTAPKAERGLPWPIDGLAYIAAFIGPMSAGPMIGVITRDWGAGAIGLLMGIGIAFFNAWFSDRFLDPWIARFQRPLQNGAFRILANTAAFAWAIMLCAFSMLAPIMVFGGALLPGIR